MLDVLFVLATYLVVLAATWGIAYWAERAEKDRSANVGLYLVLGAPGLLLFIAGLVFAIFGEPDGITFLLMGLALSLPLVKQFRQVLSRVTPMDPNSPTDMVGLGALLVTLVVLGVIAVNQGVPDEAENGSDISYLDLILQNLFLVALAFICVGIGIRRDAQSAIERLGLVWPGWKAVGIAVALVVVGLIISQIGGLLTQWLQPDYAEQVNEFTGQLSEDFRTPLGVLLIGFGAAIGEETLMRGAIQPRYGIVLTSLLFSLLHLQYGLSWVIVGLFGVALLLGWERQRYGTIAAIITHALYNMAAVILTAL